MSRKKERKHNYVVGFAAEGHGVYGKSVGDGPWTWAEPLTPFQAMAMQKRLPRTTARIYRLVDVTDELLGKAKVRRVGK